MVGIAIRNLCPQKASTKPLRHEQHQHLSAIFLAVCSLITHHLLDTMQRTTLHTTHPLSAAIRCSFSLSLLRWLVDLSLSGYLLVDYRPSLLPFHQASNATPEQQPSLGLHDDAWGSGWSMSLHTQHVTGHDVFPRSFT